MTKTSYPADPAAVKQEGLKQCSTRIDRSHVGCIGLRRRVQKTLRREVEERMEQQRMAQEERWYALRLGTATTEHSHWALARMNEIAHCGTQDRKGGCGYLYHGPVGTGKDCEMMHAQVFEHRGDIVLTFWPSDGRARRLLVTQRGTAFVEVWTKAGPSAIAHTGKYLQAFFSLVQVRVTNTPPGARQDAPPTERQDAPATGLQQEAPYGISSHE